MSNERRSLTPTQSMPNIEVCFGDFFIGINLEFLVDSNGFDNSFERNSNNTRINSTMD